MRPIIANLGFVMQIAGLFLIAPIISSFVLGEQLASLAFLLTGFSFFLLGFVLNALSQREDLSFRNACVLLTFSFTLLSVLGAIPYFYLNPFEQTDPVAIMVDSVFESVSGYTTTGFSVIPDVSSIPRSLAFYRSLTELIGGIGIVFLVLGFFYNGSTLHHISRLIGAIDLHASIRKSFLTILLLYLSYMTVIALAFVFLGFDQKLDAFSLVISGLMTGGLSPVANFSAFLAFPFNALLILAMLLGSISFTIHYRVFSFNLKGVVKKELLLFFAILIFSTVWIVTRHGLDPSETLFHVVSAASGTGFQTWDIASISPGLKFIFIALMFVGGMSISTAGGIKVLRLAIFIKSVPQVIRSSLSGQPPLVSYDGKTYTSIDISMNALFIILSIVTVMVGTLILTQWGGFPLLDSVFEATSAFGTAGLTTGIATPSLAISLKITLMVLMLLGRVEIIPFLMLFVRERGQDSKKERPAQRLARLNQP